MEDRVKEVSGQAVKAEVHPAELVASVWAKCVAAADYLTDNYRYSCLAWPKVHPDRMAQACEKLGARLSASQLASLRAYAQSLDELQKASKHTSRLYDALPEYFVEVVRQVSLQGRVDLKVRARNVAETTEAQAAQGTVISWRQRLLEKLNGLRAALGNLKAKMLGR